MIEARELTKRYGKTLAVDRLSFVLEGGSITGFLGPNGSGKTTTLRMLLGLVRPTGGTVSIDGKAYRGLDDPIRRVGAVLEATGFHPGRSGRNHLRTVAAAAGLPGARVDEVLDLVALREAAKRPVKTYSLGMRQRLGVATALLGDPEVLLLDEPANGLDPEGIRWLREFLRGYVAGGRTVFISSHVLAEIAQIVERVVIIRRGGLVAHSTLEELTARAAGSVRVRSPQSARLGELLRAAGIDVAASDDDLLAVAGAPAARVGEIAAANGIVLHELAAEAPTLEEAFLEVTS